MRDDGSDAAFVIRELRMPRLLTGMLAGGALGLAGAIVQSVTRNPLGEPGLLGVTSGAAFAMALCMTYFTLSTPTMLLLSTVGGIVAALMTLSISLGARLNPLYLTLTGMSVNLFFAAAIIVLLICANVEANGIYYWLTGSLINRTWEHVHLLWPWVIPALLLAIVFAGKLDLLRMDDDNSRRYRHARHALEVAVRCRCRTTGGGDSGGHGPNHLHWFGRPPLGSLHPGR